MGLLSGLGDVLGLDTKAGTNEAQAALAALQAVQAPSISQMTLPQLQQYVSAGTLSPSQYQAILTDPNLYSQVISNTQDNSGTAAQKSALQQMSGIAQHGSTPIMQAQLVNNTEQMNQANKANDAAIMQNARERGVGGGGLEFVNQQLSNQGNAQNAYLGGVNAASNNAQLALQALANTGSMGATLQGQSNQSAQSQAAAAQQISQYNQQLQSAANQYNTQAMNQAQQMNLGNQQNISNANTQNTNQRTMYNAALPQQNFNNQMQKAGGIANQYNNMANIAQNQAQANNAFIGDVIGGAATVGGDYLSGGATAAMGAAPKYGGSNGPNPKYNTSQYSPNGYAQGGEVCYAKGGEVHDHDICMRLGGAVPGDAKVAGDSTKNDTVHARLSPHEIVLPRSVTMRPDAPQQAANFVAQIKAKNMADAVRMMKGA